jgi:anaerobic selenocysteine-containing dehydrogenase
MAAGISVPYCKKRDIAAGLFRLLNWGMPELAVRPPGSWGRSTVQTACPLDCPDACSLDVTVERGRIVTIDGSRVAPSTEGYICGKVRRFDRRVYSEERLQYPAVRTGAKGKGLWKRVTWDEALELAAAKMRHAAERLGAESIVPFHYGGSNGILTNDLEDARFFRRLGATRLARTVCAAPTTAAATALYGKMAGVAYEDYAQAKLVVVWGANPTASGIHLVPHIKKAHDAGAKLVVIDPRRTALARQADLHLALRPGTDLPLALAVIRELFESGRADRAFLEAHTTGADDLRRVAREWTIERAATECGVDAAAVRTFVDWYAAISPAVLRCGWGQERNRNGGSATMAILALPAVAGKFGVRSGGYTMSNSAIWGITAETLIDTPAPETRVLNMNHLGRALTEWTDPPVSVLFAYNCNPLATMPDQNRVRRGLEREDLFTIVFDQVMTDSALYADLLLPATTFLEHYDIAKGYGAYHLQLVRPVIDAVGEARPNHDVFRDLGARMGIAEPDVDGLGESGALLDVTGRLPDATRAGLYDDGIVAGPAGGRPVQFVDVWPNTPDRRVHLFPADVIASHGLFTYQPDPATPEAPLALISPASERTISSTLGEFRPGVVALKIHPADAAARSITDRDTIRVWNTLGEVQCLARVTPEVPPGTVSLPKGLWARSTINGSTANALAPDSLTDIAGGACFNDARVDVQLLGRH